MSQAAGQNTLIQSQFLQGTWGSGGFDEIGDYVGGSTGQGAAILSGDVSAFGNPIDANLNGTIVTLHAYATVAGGQGIVLTSQDFGTMYIFLYETFDSTQAYPLVYAAGNPNAPCFVSGTQITTSRGAVSVEKLKVGDSVCLVDRSFAKIVWLGRRLIRCQNFREAEKIWPVRVAQSAFAAGIPHQPLLLSPDHAVFIHNALIPIRYLINDTTIKQIPTKEVDYWHVELPTHSVIIANGLAAESYLDTGNRKLLNPV